ncbi:hypothetical protein HOY82DRAFT_621998 [Tuber indicum]|nr:hypothetical protein HOY82DRAFT_621998 [Tuber indicum]
MLYPTYALLQVPSNTGFSPRAAENWGTVIRGRAEWVIAGRLETKLAQSGTKVDGGNRKTDPKFLAIKGPHGYGVRAIVKDKTTTFLKAKKATRLQRMPDARERHLVTVRVQIQRTGRGLQEKEMRGKGTEDMLEEMIRMCRDRWGITQLGVETRKKRRQ